MRLTEEQIWKVAEQLGWKYYDEVEWLSPQFDIPPKAIRSGLMEPYTWNLTDEGMEEIATGNVCI